MSSPPQVATAAAITAFQASSFTTSWRTKFGDAAIALDLDGQGFALALFAVGGQYASAGLREGRTDFRADAFSRTGDERRFSVETKRGRKIAHDLSLLTIGLAHGCALLMTWP
jgi:hypothetical protein